MVKAVVLYGPPEDPDAFERDYADTHTALAHGGVSGGGMQTLASGERTPAAVPSTVAARRIGTRVGSVTGHQPRA